MLTVDFHVNLTEQFLFEIRPLAYEPITTDTHIVKIKVNEDSVTLYMTIEQIETLSVTCWNYVMEYFEAIKEDANA